VVTRDGSASPALPSRAAASSDPRDNTKAHTALACLPTFLHDAGTNIFGNRIGLTAAVYAVTLLQAASVSPSVHVTVSWLSWTRAYSIRRLF
jgi:hypothetical protein